MKFPFRGRIAAAVGAIAIISVGLQLPAQLPASAGTVSETTGGVVHTWTNYSNAGGTEGPNIASNQTVQINCRVQGFKVADGNTWWYQIASSPWNNVYYGSADAFYNNGQTSGSLIGTPFVDPNVPTCGSGGVNETTGGVVHTWTDYSDAGGTEGPNIGSNQTVQILCRVQGFQVADGNTWWYQIASSPWNSTYYGSADAFYNNGQTSGSLVGTPFVDPNVPLCGSGGGGSGGGGGSSGTTETPGGPTHTWTNYLNAGGTQGQTIASNSSVQIACKVTGFAVADGNTWWYEIASSPWNGTYYASADAFYNNGQTSGTLVGTPFVDPAVPNCAEPGQPRPGQETTGGPTNTWGNYSHAGGPEGATIPTNDTVEVACRVTGFAVQDGDSWWYLIASAPWGNAYYASADAFYNNGRTSGSLIGTPFVDTSIPICVNNQEAPIYSTAVGSSEASSHSTGCVSGDPIDCASGDFWQTFTDVSIAGRGPALDLTRTYNDQSAGTAGIFGDGWTSSYDQHLTLNTDGSITITLADGSQLVAEPNGSGGYSLPPSSDDAFATASAGTYVLTEGQTKLLTFSSTGQLVSISDLNGYTTSLAYNSGGRLSTVTDSAGRQVTFSFGTNGFVSSVTDPMGRTTTYGYTGNDLSNATDPLGRSWNFAYNASNQMTSMTDPTGGSVTNAYDSLGRVTSQTDAAGLTTRYAYTGDNFSSLGGTTTITDPHGNIELEKYANGFMTQVTTANGTPEAATTTYTYDPSSYGVTSVTDPNGNTTKYTYNSSGHALTETDPLGNTTTDSYNSLGERLTSTTPLGDVTSNTYDSNGNLLTTTNPGGGVTKYAYGNAAHPGDITSVSNADGHTTALTYDAAGDLATSASSPDAGISDTVMYGHDTDGEQTCIASPNATATGASCLTTGGSSGTTTIVYNADSEQTSSTTPNGGTTTSTYDGNGNQLSSTDPEGNVTTQTYDHDNRPLSRTVGSGGSATSTTQSAYDIATGSGSCTSPPQGTTYCTTTTNPNGGVTVDYFDARNNKIEEVLPGGQTTRFTYDLDGNKVTQTDAEGRVTTSAYNADNALISITYSDGHTPNVTYAYNTDGQRTTMTDGTGTTSYTYNSSGQVLSVTAGTGAAVGYGYDAAGNITSLAYPNGKSVTRTYDGAGRLSSVADWLGNTTTFAYDADGNVTGTSYPNGDAMTAGFDSLDGMTGATVTGSAGTSQLLGISYTRNADELITQEVDQLGAVSRTTSYSYNDQNELTASNGDSYGYDAAGDLTANGGTTQTFNGAQELTSSAGSSGSTNYGWDAVGDLTTVTQASGAAADYSYDQAERLVSASATPPSVTGLTPSSGSTDGGTSVTITGSGFTNATSVHFGSTAATSFSVVSDSEITAVSPAAAAGTEDVTVTGPAGTSADVSVDSFKYVSPPAVTGLTPNSGPSNGGITVTIAGTAFTGATKVRFGSVQATSFTVVSDTEITAVAPPDPSVPPGSTSQVENVFVITPYGESASGSGGQFTYVNPPAITSVSPAAGPLSGGTTVTIGGTAFTGATQVEFGGTAATSYSVDSDTQITATAPASSAGSVDVTVTTPYGLSATGQRDHFTYAPLPMVTSLSPASGLAAGGTKVDIFGTGFSLTSGVVFGTLPAASFTVVSDTEISAVSPAQLSGTYDVHVTTPGGTSVSSTQDQYSYEPVPVISSVSPDTGLAKGGASIALTGTGFTGATEVLFGQTPVSKFTVVSATRITLTAPAESLGSVNVSVLTPLGRNVTSSSDVFTYGAPTITAVAPAQGPKAGGTKVTITGVGLIGVTKVTFGSSAGSSIKIVSGNELTVQSPSQAAGTYDVTITGPGGTSAKSAVDQYTSEPLPTVTQLSPKSGPVTGGTDVTITGTGLTGATKVLFGTAPSTHVTVESASQIVAVAPAHAAGIVRLSVTTPFGVTPSSTLSEFTYTKVTTSATKQTATSTKTPLKRTANAAVGTTGGAEVAQSQGTTPTTVATYTYNGDGLRMSETTSTGTAQFTWDSTLSTPEILFDNTNYYIYGPNGEPIEQISNAGSPTYFVHDAIGSTRALLLQNGSIGADFNFDEFGNEIGSAGSAVTPLLFAQSYSDTATGLAYMVNRSYDSATGQFTSIDPALSSTGEPYEYAGDDPTNIVDPSGLFGWNPLRDIAEAYSDAQKARQSVDNFLSTQVGSYVSFIVGQIPVVGPAAGIISDVYDVTSSFSKFVADGCFGASGGDARCNKDDQEGISSSEHLIRDALLAIPKTAVTVISDIWSIASLFGPVQLGSGTLSPGSAGSSAAPSSRSTSSSQCG